MVNACRTVSPYPSYAVTPTRRYSYGAPELLSYAILSMRVATQVLRTRVSPYPSYAVTPFRPYAVSPFRPHALTAPYHGSQILLSLDLPPSQASARPSPKFEQHHSAWPRRRPCGVGFRPTGHGRYHFPNRVERDRIFQGGQISGVASLRSGQNRAAQDFARSCFW